jgi:hypothetical protein
LGLQPSPRGQHTSRYTLYTTPTQPQTSLLLLYTLGDGAASSIALKNIAPLVLHMPMEINL